MLDELLKKILDRLVNGVILLDFNLNLVYRNQFVQNACRREILVGEPLFSIFPELKNTRIEKAVMDAKEKKISCFLTHNLNKEQFPFHSTQRNTPMKQNIYVNPVIVNNKTEFILLQIIDVTYNNLKEELLREKTKQERILNHSLYSEILAKNEYQAKLLEQNNKLEKMNLELLRLDAEKNELLSIVAHDLRNPLMMIQTILDNLNTKLGVESIYNEILLLGSTTTRLIDFVNNLLDVYSIQTGNLTSEVQEIDLKSYLNQILEYQKVLANAKQIQIHNYIELSHPIVRIDTRALHQGLENYLSNAIKFSPKGAIIELKVYQTEKQVFCEVKDSGPGLTEEESKQLFQKFKKLSPRPTAGESSNGLGLFIVKKYVEAAGGSVWVQTKLGEGSTFCLSLPWYERKDIGKTFVEHYRNKFFLYIDDDEITRKIFKNQMLQISNFVDVAENSQVGIQMMNSKNYDIVFIDMNLGGELGIYVIKQLKTTNSSSNTKYVLCSGDVSADSISQFQNYGFDYAMPKDFRAEKLFQVVQFLLN